MRLTNDFSAAMMSRRLTIPNITPDYETGIGNWSDDQLARAIREGIGHDGRVLMSMMPYLSFKHLCDEDLAYYDQALFIQVMRTGKVVSR